MRSFKNARTQAEGRRPAESTHSRAQENARPCSPSILESRTPENHRSLQRQHAS
jgi:hypothetical protein